MMLTSEQYLAGKVRRWHTHHSLTQTVADHSHGVAMLLLQRHPSPSLDLIKAALMHDLAEYITGDIPSPAKREFIQLGRAADEAEVVAFKRLKLSVPHLSYIDEMWLKWADYQEALLFLKRCSTMETDEYGRLQHLVDRAESALVEAGELSEEVPL